MAPAVLRRAAWPAAAAAAAGVLLALALHGQRPASELDRFSPAGVMLALAPEDVREVRVAAGDRRWRFVRDADGAWRAAGPGDAAPVTEGLRFLHVSAPQRVLEPVELGETPLAELGLDPPRYAVSVEAAGRAPFVIHFGGPNAQGLAQYAQVPDRPGVVLLPRYVGERWEAAMRAR